MKNQSYRSGNLPKFVEFLAKQFSFDPEYAKAALVHSFPDLQRKEFCANCSASMAEYVFSFDCLDAVLLYKMGQEFNNRLRKGYDFTVANQIYVQELPTTYAIKSRTTQCAKLGLVAKLKQKGAGGIWVITRRGFAALRGESVPKVVKVFRNEIQEHYEDTTTLHDAFKLHREKVEDAIARHKDPRTDYRKDFENYNPAEWYDIANYHDGQLI